MLPRQNTLSLPPPSPQNLTHPTGNLIKPTSSNEHPRNGIDQPNHQIQEPRPLLADQQQDRLNVILEKDTRNQVRGFGDWTGLAGCRVLVCEDCVAGLAGFEGGRVEGVGVEGGAAFCVEGWDDGEEVLEFVVVDLAFGDGFVEGVLEAWVVWAEGELSYHVGEVEC